MASRLLNLLAIFPYIVFAQNQPSDSLSGWKTLEEVEVNALSLPTSQQEYPGMIGVIDLKKLSLSDPTIASGVVNQVPGVYWHSGALNTNRITIRGIGSRSPFSTNKIRAYYADIPLTDGGGETAVEDIDLAFVGGIEIHKGANSTLFGSGLGGTVLLKKISDKEEFVKLNTTLGSYGMLKSGLVGNISAGKVKARVGYQLQKSDGYRNNNAFERQSVFYDLSYQQRKTSVNLLGLFMKQKAFIPSSLGITDYTESPTNAAFTWGSAQGFEDYNRWLFGLSLEQELRNKSKVITSLYSIGREAFEPRPFNILAEKNSGIGVRSRWQKVGEVWSFHAGFEGYSDKYESQTYENLYQNNGGQGSLQGQLFSSGKQPRSYFNLFAESKYYLKEKTILSFGINMNKTKYRLETNFPDISSATKKFETVLSPRLSVTYQLNANANIFATISHGFSPPSVDDSSNPDGSFNLEIQPEKGWNRELGFKHASEKINFQFSAYSMDITDLLVTRRTAEDVVFGVNAGRTLHNGMETSLDYLLLASKHTELVGRITYSYSDFTFKEFIDDANSFTGNQLTGVPKNQLNMTLAYQMTWFFSGLSFQYVDDMPITDDNAVFSQSYQLLNLYSGANLSFGEKWSSQVMVRLNNVFDVRYAAMLAINARSFGASEPRYYYPGMPLNYQVSASIAYRL